MFSDGNNYYVVNNRIDKYVICYLLYSRYDVYQNPECCKYKLNIIDHSANIIEISERDTIYLYEDNYEIIEVIGRNHYLDKENISDSENEEGSEESYEKIKKE